MSTKTAPTPTYYKFSELIIDPSLSGRSEKEIRDNAKQLAPIIDASGGWDAMQPGQVEVNGDGKPRVLAGFTRIAAEQVNGRKGGWFFQVDPKGELEARLKCLTTNEGKPISRLHQGELFKSLVNGVVADDFAGATADPANVKDWKIQPMDEKDIAAKIGKSAEHVRQCIVIHDASPEIRELIESDAISHNIVIVADNWAKHDPAKALKILKAAVREADGKKATKTHMDAIKPQFVEQKAVTSKTKKADAASESGKDESESENEADTKETEPDDSGGTREPQELNLEAPPVTPKQASKKELKSIREAVMTVVLETDTEIDDDLATRIVDRLIDAKLIVESAPF